MGNKPNLLFDAYYPTLRDQRETLTALEPSIGILTIMEQTRALAEIVGTDRSDLREERRRLNAAIKKHLDKTRQGV